MNKKDINIKRTLINAFKEIKSDLSELTLKELISQFTKDVNEFDKVNLEREAMVVSEFTDVYLKKLHKDTRVFGDELEVIHIKSIEPNGFTDRYERTYLLSGNRLKFSKSSFFMRDFDTSVYSMYTEKSLAGFTRITKEEYDSHVATYDNIIEELLEVLNRD